MPHGLSLRCRTKPNVCMTLFVLFAAVPEFVEHPQDFVAFQGESVRLECIANGTPEAVISWVKDGRPLDINRTRSVLKTYLVWSYYHSCCHTQICVYYLNFFTMPVSNSQSFQISKCSVILKISICIVCTACVLALYGFLLHSQVTVRFYLGKAFQCLHALK